MHQKSRFPYLLLAVTLIFAFVLSACQPAATPTPEPAAPVEAPTEAPKPTEPPAEPTAVPEPEVGSPEHPIKVLFVPSVDAQVIVSGGQVMADALNKATGMTFEVTVATSYAATIEEMGASPKDTIGFIPALGYVFASELCGVDVSFKAVRRGFDVYWAQILVARDSDIKELKDLNGKKWGYTDPGSTSGYMVPLAMFQDMGITPGESVETGGHPQAVKAVYNGEVDFATTFFSPATKPEGEEPWKVGDDPEIPADKIESCALTEDKKSIVCDGWVVNDARGNIREEAPDVVQKVRILAISPAIPNDTLSFSPEFPAEIRAKIEAALVEFAKTEEWNNSIGNKDFYGWSGLNPAEDAEYDFVRKMVEAAGVKLEDLGK